MKDGDVVDFASAIPQRWDDPALIIRVERRLSMSGSPHYLAASIDQETTTPSGRKGKPKHLIALVVEEDEGIGGLIKSLAHVFAIGEVEIGKQYPDPSTETEGAAE